MAGRAAFDAAAAAAAALAVAARLDFGGRPRRRTTGGAAIGATADEESPVLRSTDGTPFKRGVLRPPAPAKGTGDSVLILRISSSTAAPPPGPGPALPITGSALSSIEDDDEEEEDPEDDEEDDDEEGDRPPPPPIIGGTPTDIVVPVDPLPPRIPAELVPAPLAPEPSICVLTTKSRNKLDVYCCVGAESPRMLSASEPLSTRRIAALTSAGRSLSLEQKPPSASAVSTSSALVDVPAAVSNVVVVPDELNVDLAGVDVDRGGLLSILSKSLPGGPANVRRLSFAAYSPPLLACLAPFDC
uniref:Putative extracellular matrix protein 2 n=1 Tax=Anopheles darlingi TaxID=43151 RepID=A0A2M4D2R6_ANODA